MTTQTPPLGLPPPHQMQQAGGLIIGYAATEYYLNMAINCLDGSPMQVDEHGNTFMVPAKIAQKIGGMCKKVTYLTKLAQRRGDPALVQLVNDFSAAIRTAREARNFLAHGILGGEPGRLTFYSQRDSTSMTMDEIVAATPAVVSAFNACKAIAERVLDTQPSAPRA